MVVFGMQLYFGATSTNNFMKWSKHFLVVCQFVLTASSLMAIDNFDLVTPL